jgi:hypothetical protein
MLAGINPNSKTSKFVPKQTKLTQISDEINQIYKSNCIKCEKHNPRMNTVRCTEELCEVHQELSGLRDRLANK